MMHGADVRAERTSEANKLDRNGDAACDWSATPSVLTGWSGEGLADALDPPGGSLDDSLSARVPGKWQSSASNPNLETSPGKDRKP